MLAARPLEAAVRFGDVRDYAHIGLAFPVFADARPAPGAVDLPRATAFRLGSGADARIEDRYDVCDLWYAHTVLGVWTDEAGNMLSLARLDTRLPAKSDSPPATRTSYAASVEPIRLRDESEARAAVWALVPDATGEESVRAHRYSRRYIRDVEIVPVTNTNVKAVSFRPVEGPFKETRFLAVLTIAPGENLEKTAALFDVDFLDAVRPLAKDALPPVPVLKTEDDRLCADLRASVESYPETWHTTEGDCVVVLDDLSSGVSRTFVESLTNGWPRLRRAFASTVPGLASATNTTVVARIFADHADYAVFLDGEDPWSAAVWVTGRREIAAFLPREGTERLLETFRHEAFHQYLAYAAALVPASPWFNEGHAELFARTRAGKRKEPETVFESDEAYAALVRADAAALARAIPAFVYIDYDTFYGGTDEERLCRYALAWSMAYFLEKGADDVLGKPFKNVRRVYMEKLLETESAEAAVRAALPDALLLRFAEEWLKFWSAGGE